LCGGAGLVQVLESGKIIPVNERRRWPRHSIDIPLRVVAGARAPSVEVPGHGTEINEGGVTVDAKVELRVGDEVEVELLPPDFPNTPIRLRGAIRHGAGSHYGVEFLRAGETGEEQQLATLRRLLSRGHAGAE
jgi:hypothetical protein